MKGKYQELTRFRNQLSFFATNELINLQKKKINKLINPATKNNV